MKYMMILKSLLGVQELATKFALDPFPGASYVIQLHATVILTWWFVSL